MLYKIFSSEKNVYLSFPVNEFAGRKTVVRDTVRWDLKITTCQINIIGH